MFGGNLGSRLYGDVSVMKSTTKSDVTVPTWHLCTGTISNNKTNKKLSSHFLLAILIFTVVKSHYIPKSMQDKESNMRSWIC